MALTIEWNAPFGLNCEAAHCVVKGVQIVKEENPEGGEENFVVQYSGLIFINADIYGDGASAIGGFNGRFELDLTDDDPDQHNIVRQCYLDLKTMDEFSDGVDC